MRHAEPAVPGSSPGRVRARIGDVADQPLVLGDVEPRAEQHQQEPEGPNGDGRYPPKNVSTPAAQNE